MIHWNVLFFQYRAQAVLADLNNFPTLYIPTSTTDLFHSLLLVYFSLFSVYFFKIFLGIHIAETVVWRFSVKYVFLKHLCWNLLFNRVTSWRAATLLKKRLQHRSFPMNIANFLRITSLKRIPVKPLVLECYSTIFGTQE